MMFKRVAPLLAIFLAVATTAQAQSGPGGGGPGGGGGRGGHGGGRAPPSSGGSPTNAAAPAPKPPKPENQIEIVGVVTAIDLDAQRITIAYEAVDELNWPHGTMPFAVYKAELLKTVTVGERVRFKLDGQRITELATAPPARPVVAPQGLR
jgi:Cu/Ag efflux protein CusF